MNPKNLDAFLIYEEFNRPEDEDEYPRTSIRDILADNPDYQPGPIKHYTQEEIEEYELLRSKGL